MQFLSDSIIICKCSLLFMNNAWSRDLNVKSFDVFVFLIVMPQSHHTLFKGEFSIATANRGGAWSQRLAGTRSLAVLMLENSGCWSLKCAFLWSEMIIRFWFHHPIGGDFVGATASIDLSRLRRECILILGFIKHLMQLFNILFLNPSLPTLLALLPLPFLCSLCFFLS